MSRDFLLDFALRIHQLVVLELSSFLPTHTHFVFEYLGENFPSYIFLLEDELVLFEILYIHDGRPVIPIFEHQLVATAHRYNY